MEETKIVVLTDKREIKLNDENNIFLTLATNGKTQYEFPVPYPSAGYGGGTLSLSPSEQYLLFSYYSGQSQEAFMLFKIDKWRLELLYQSEYFYGENATFCFSNDEKFLLQAFRINWWYADIAETDESGNIYYKFGAINSLNIPQKQLDTHIIHVYPSNDWEEEVTDTGLFEFSELVNDCTLVMTMPWGKEMIDCPLKDVVIIKPMRE